MFDGQTELSGLRAGKLWVAEVFPRSAVSISLDWTEAIYALRPEPLGGQMLSDLCRSALCRRRENRSVRPEDGRCGSVRPVERKLQT